MLFCFIINFEVAQVFAFDVEAEEGKARVVPEARGGTRVDEQEVVARVVHHFEDV